MLRAARIASRARHGALVRIANRLSPLPSHGTHMLKPCSMLLALGLASTASAQLAISIGIRETAAGGGSFTSIGADGGSLGGIEWVNRDAQTLVLDGTWQQFTFNIATDPLTGFAGTTANSVLDGAFGVLE